MPQGDVCKVQDEPSNELPTINPVADGLVRTTNDTFSRQMIP